MNYTRVVAIVHPMILEIEYFEEQMRERAQHRSLPLTDRDLNPFAKYDDRRKVVILPGRDEDLSLPNTYLLTPRITLSQNDVAISDFNTHRSLVNNVYPQWDKVVEEFVKNAGHLLGVTVGGYSSSDCVEKFALACDNAGIPTVMDEAITELYYLAWPDIEMCQMYNINERPKVLQQRQETLRAKFNPKK